MANELKPANVFAGPSLPRRLKCTLRSVCAWKQTVSVATWQVLEPPRGDARYRQRAVGRVGNEGGGIVVPLIRHSRAAGNGDRKAGITAAVRRRTRGLLREGRQADNGEGCRRAGGCSTGVADHHVIAA